MVDRIEELGEIQIHHPAVSAVGVLQDLLKRRMAPSIRPEPMTARVEYGFVLLDEYLGRCLLYQSVPDCGDSQWPGLSPFFLWNVDSANGQGLVLPCP